MSVLIGKIAAVVTKAAHSKEVQHDAALFVGALTVTGILGDLSSGVPLTLDAVAAAVIVAGRRALALRLAGKVSILEDAAADIRQGGTRCRVGLVLDKLASDERAEVETILTERQDIQGSAIARALARRGHDIRPGSVTRHRRGECSCDRLGR